VSAQWLHAKLLDHGVSFEGTIYTSFIAAATAIAGSRFAGLNQP
jgi:hypothetical protein